jgi:hypothetical protein
MNCADIDQLLSQGLTVAELRALPGVPAHLASCPRCTALLHWVGEPIPGPDIPAPVVDRIKSIVHNELKPVRPLPSLRTGIAAAFLLVATLAAVHAQLFGTRGWRSLQSIELTLLLALCSLIIAAAAASLWASLRPGAKQPIHPLLPIVLLAVGFPFLSALLFPHTPDPHFLEEGVICLAVGLIFSAIAAAIAAAFARRGYATDWRVTGSLIGALGGALGVVALMISCPNHEVAHMALWHGLVILTSIAAGFLAGSRRSRS